MKKHLFLVLTVAMLAAVSCKKGSKNINNNDADNEPLIAASTGWQRVSTIPYMNSRSGLPGSHAMTPYDVTTADGEIALLYSEDFKLQGLDGHNFFKLKVPSGTANPKANAEQLSYSRAGTAAPVYRFVPESFTTMSAQFKPDELSIYDGKRGLIAAAGYGVNPMYSARWLKDGTVLMGICDSRKITARWSYLYPQVKNFDYVTNEWPSDSTQYWHSSPMKLNDGQFYDLVLSTVNNRMYFSIIKNNAPLPSGGKANFDIICRNRVPELNASATYTILSSDVADDSHTILLGESSPTDYMTINKVYGLRWKKGTTVLERLYEVNIDKSTSQTLLELGRSVSQPNEIRFTPEGAAYFISGITPKGQALFIIGAGGLKQYGKTSDATLYEEYKISACRYLKGAFYAVVHPYQEFKYDYSSAKFRMELVKLNIK